MPDLNGPISSWLPTVWYGGFLPGLPDLLFGQYSGFRKLWIVRSHGERRALLAALDRSAIVSNGALNFRDGPDRAVSAPTSDDDYIALYAPPEDGWPWITLVSATMTPAAAKAIGAARGRYAWDADDAEAAAIDRVARLGVRYPGAEVRTPLKSNAN